MEVSGKLRDDQISRLYCIGSRAYILRSDARRSTLDREIAAQKNGQKDAERERERERERRRRRRHLSRKSRFLGASTLRISTFRITALGIMSQTINWLNCNTQHNVILSDAFLLLCQVSLCWVSLSQMSWRLFFYPLTLEHWEWPAYHYFYCLLQKASG
jgi:hypothetical protein